LNCDIEDTVSAFLVRFTDFNLGEMASDKVKVAVRVRPMNRRGKTTKMMRGDIACEACWLCTLVSTSAHHNKSLVKGGIVDTLV
jgi:hypothetical protein